MANFTAVLALRRIGMNWRNRTEERGGEADGGGRGVIRMMNHSIHTSASDGGRSESAYIL